MSKRYPEQLHREIEKYLEFRTVMIHGKECYFMVSHYHYGKNVAIALITEMKEPMAELTVNMPHNPILLPKNHFHVKTWSENKPIAKACIESGLFIDTGKRMKTGFTETQIWTINLKKEKS